ncbi:2,6-dihydropseudooxynicotine hydrolase [Paenarthrobacter nicotinovorans]|jgi:2,6-dihydroxypseudooxynicotine hydrolase|uniref:2,6-dihydropseudooxynicotine hydrolase n=1 Tax=Paenarthrobacter nicotinovorans TaxID=29320 RepID=UPI003D671B53
MTVTSQVKPEDEMLNWGRLILDGVSYSDMVGARDRPKEVTWFDYWMSLANEYEQEAERKVALGHDLSAGELLMSAALCAQYAQFLWFDERRQKGQARKVELYQKAAPLLSPPAERHELVVDGIPMPVYVRIPEGPGPHPAVIMLGGLESTKEESFQMENLVLDRGMATATFDGPGQGEMFEYKRIAGDYEKYTSAVVDLLTKLEAIRNDAIGVLGRSLGGNYALKSAACEPRLAACISWGGFSDLDYWDLETPLTKESWKYVSKVDTLEEARLHVHAALETRDVLSQIACPTYILHGVHDEVPLSFVDTVLELVPAEHLNLVVEKDGDHCCHNLGIRPRLEMADWLYDVLVAGKKVAPTMKGWPLNG